MEQIIKLTGRIAEVMPVASGVSDRTGNAWKSQEYLFEYFAWSGAKYANRLVARVFGEDDIAKFNLKQGEEVTLTIRFDANKSKDGTRWFNEIRINNVERPQAAQQAPQAANAPAEAQQSVAQPIASQAANAPQPNNYPPGFERPATSPENGKDDDLPF
jgi:hypothetical protein